MSVSVVACPRNHRDRHSQARGVGLAVAAPVSRPFEDGAEVADELRVDLAPACAGGEHDALDQVPCRGRRLVTPFRFVQGVGQALHLAPLDLRHPGVRELPGFDVAVRGDQRQDVARPAPGFAREGEVGVEVEDERRSI